VTYSDEWMQNHCCALAGVLAELHVPAVQIVPQSGGWIKLEAGRDDLLAALCEHVKEGPVEILVDEHPIRIVIDEHGVRWSSGDSEVAECLADIWPEGQETF
jgi:hypothetical protein